MGRAPASGVAEEAGIGKGTVYLHFPSKEEAVLSHVDRIVELAGVPRHEGSRLVADQPFRVAAGDGLAEARDALPANLLVDEGRQQPRRQSRILRLLANQLRGPGARHTGLHQDVEAADLLTAIRLVAAGEALLIYPLHG